MALLCGRRVGPDPVRPCCCYLPRTLSVCCGNNEAMDIVEEMKNKAPVHYALAMIVKKAALTNSRSFNIERMQERFAIETRTTLWLDDWGNRHELDVMIFQLGTESLSIRA